uniref:Uncharacterized protein n=1 Tax=Anguilla anguilla TaxID=7936 RepID=A0A0E9VIY2_ANGAN
MVSSMLTVRVLSPYWIFSAILQSKSTGSWETMPICDLRKGTSTCKELWPSMSTVPWSGS